MIVYSYIIVSAALAMAQGSTTPPAIRDGSLPGHSNSSLLYTLLQVAGFSETCISGALDYCSAAQEETHYPSLIQELQENKMGLQEVKDDLYDVKKTVQQEIREVKVELQKVQVEAQEGKKMVQQEMQDVKVEVEEVKGMLQQVMLELLKSDSLPRHCKDLLDSGDSGSGQREVFPTTEKPHHTVTVYCDQVTDGGGWTVFQRRVNNGVRLSFERSWQEYQAGFGNLNGEFWLGLDFLHELTSTAQELRIDLHDYEGHHRWAKYGTFQVGPEDSNYRLTVGSYSGDAGDAMTRVHNGQEFSTHDKGLVDCAKGFRGAWWYENCHTANLNGYQHVGENSPFGEGIVWQQWLGYEYSLKRTTMMFRPAL